MLKLPPITFIDRATGRREKEAVYGEWAIALLYQNRWIGTPLRWLLSHLPLFSSFYGWVQKRRFTRKKVTPFIKKYGVDPSEFEKSVNEFQSFNDFFMRHLKPSARPIAQGSDQAVLPADGRYWFFPEISEANGFVIKGQRFCLETFLGDADLAQRYAKGTLVLARLCPTDYHRFHFPCDGTPSASRFIPGPLDSVNPAAVRQRLGILAENKRMVTEIVSPLFGTVQMVEIGALAVGTILQTFTPGQPVKRGQEKGTFSFGGSAIALLFEHGKLELEADLLLAGHEGLEIRCLMGGSLGHATP